MLRGYAAGSRLDIRIDRTGDRVLEWKGAHHEPGYEDSDRSGQRHNAGAQLQQEIRDVGAGKLTASVKDPDGNVVGLLQEPA